MGCGVGGKDESLKFADPARVELQRQTIKNSERSRVTLWDQTEICCAFKKPNELA